MTQRIRYHPELDGLRTLAVTLVLIAHLPFAAGFLPWDILKWGGAALHAGYLGVDIFFVLSGFLITRILLSDRAQPTGPTVRIFFLKRILRIFPIFYLTVLYCWVVLDIPTSEVVANLLYVSNYYYSVVDDMSPLRHTWSLSVEEQFYLFWPFVVLLVPLARLNAVIVWGTVAIVILSVVLACLLLDPETAKLLTVRGVTFRILSLAAGAYMALHLEWILNLSARIPLILALLVSPLLQVSNRLLVDPSVAMQIILRPVFYGLVSIDFSVCASVRAGAKHDQDGFSGACARLCRAYFLRGLSVSFTDPAPNEYARRLPRWRRADVGNRIGAGAGLCRVHRVIPFSGITAFAAQGSDQSIKPQAQKCTAWQRG